uniref:Uncharacterized protein n=1 Tax=Anguilla anguilla TaxID=7936 RepID=A0A0E9Q1Q6_ANGAN
MLRSCIGKHKFLTNTVISLKVCVLKMFNHKLKI